MTGKLLFTEAEWGAACQHAVAAMTDFLRPYRTAIFEHKQDHGTGWGSGSFLRLGDSVFVLTNEHVARAREEKRVLCYQFDAQEDIRPVMGNHASFPYPLDLAVLPVDMKAWRDAANKSKAIEVGQIALGHDAVEAELLTFTGFAGQNVSFYFDTLFAKGVCYTAREIELPQDARFSSRFHFGLNYRPDLASSVVGKDTLPLPPGLSGSTVWNTNFVAAKMAGVSWTPEMAKVAGVIWGWPSGHACLVAIRAEFVRSFLLEISEASSPVSSATLPAPVDKAGEL